MVTSSARTPEAYIAGLSPERREAVTRVLKVILDSLPLGYEEGMQHGMISDHIPLERYPDTYNGEALGLAALASRKAYMSLTSWAFTTTQRQSSGSASVSRTAAESSTWVSPVFVSGTWTNCRSR